MFLVIVLTASGLIGCKRDESKPTESQTDISDNKGQETEKESETNRLSDYPEGTFDGEEVCKHIEINGKMVEFPWTLNKLGDEYEFEDVKINKETYMAKLMYKGEYVVDVLGKEIEVNRDTPIEYVIFSRKENVKICGIDWENTSLDVEKNLVSQRKKIKMKYAINICMKQKRCICFIGFFIMIQFMHLAYLQQEIGIKRRIKNGRNNVRMFRENNGAV